MTPPRSVVGPIPLPWCSVCGGTGTVYVQTGPEDVTGDRCDDCDGTGEPEGRLHRYAPTGTGECWHCCKNYLDHIRWERMRIEIMTGG